jgi:PiT family inorganic phosphate transporter
MIFALLLSAILWNIGTWYLGLPASSSHTLIGSILGVGLANAVMSHHPVLSGVNWSQVYKVFLTLLVSPVVGFVCAGLMLLLLKLLIKSPALFQPPAPNAPPPLPIRATLIATCTGVSFFHGSNDGQKGMGLLLLILIGVLPAEYALNLGANRDDLRKLEQTSALVQPTLDAHAAAAVASPTAAAAVATEKPAVTGAVAKAVGTDALSGANPVTAGGPTSDGKLTAKTFTAVAAANRELAGLIAGKSSLGDVRSDLRKTLRTDLYLVDQTLAKMDKAGEFKLDAEHKTVAGYHGLLDATTKYLPAWVKVAVALALGCGTMIGWKRIVTTVGEKIGKEHLNYAQGMSAELVAMATIFAADKFGMPVSTTHVLSSGIAGTMAANKSGLQAATMRNILLAWVLTLPVCVLLGAALFAAGLLVVISNLAAAITGVIVAIALATAVWRVIVLSRRSRESDASTSTAAVATGM